MSFILTSLKHLIQFHVRDWKVISGVPQGSILGPLIYINDLDVGLSSTVRLFAGNCAIFRVITDTKDCDDLQADLNWLYYWTQLNLNQSKCKVMRITNTRKRFNYTYSLISAGLTLSDILLACSVVLSCTPGLTDILG